MVQVAHLKLGGGALLQYADDLLIITRAPCQQHLGNTIATFNHLASRGCKVTAQKAQICQQAVKVSWVPA